MLFTFVYVFSGSTRIILEPEGNIWKIQKKGTFHDRIVKKGTPNLTFPYVHNLFINVLIKQIFEINKSLRVASGSLTQF